MIKNIVYVLLILLLTLIILHSLLESTISKVIEKFISNQEITSENENPTTIEHFENDKSLVEFLSRHLKPNGKLIVTVPAFQFLFSSYDVALHHYRRYSKSSFKKLFEKDFNILKLSYFNFFLFIPSCIVVLLMKILNIKFARKIQTTPNFFLNKLLYLIFASESFFLRFLSFPFGISLIIVVERKK